MNVSNSAYSDGNPSWSSNGTKIAFTRNTTPQSVWTMSADGSNPVQVSDPNFAASDPAWGPEGMLVYLKNDGGGGWDLWYRYPDGVEQQRTFTPAVVEHNPSWSQEGLKIA